MTASNRLPAALLGLLLVFAAACGGDGAGGGNGEGVGGSEVDVHRFDTPDEVGSGLLDGMTPDGSAAYVEEPDGRFPEPGCEGQPEPVMFLQPLDGGERTLAGDGETPLQGTIVRGGSEGRIAVVSACEQFFTDLFVASEAEDGTLSGIARVEPAVPDGFLLNAASLSWDASGSALLGALQHENAPDGDPAQVVSIDPSSGQVTKIFDAEQGTGVFKVGQMENGRYVVATNLVVSFRDEAGVVIAGFQGQGFEISPDKEQMVVYGRNLMLVEQDDTRARQLVEHIQGREISNADFSPGGGAVAINRYNIDGGEAEIAIVTPEDSKFTSVVTAGQYGRAFFSGDGRALGFNQFGSEPDFTSRLFVARFEEAS